MSIQMNDLQIMYNALSIFLFDNFKNIRKDFKKEIKKIYKYKEILNQDIYNIVNDIINNSTSSKKNKVKNIKTNTKTDIPNGYKLCSQQRTKNRGTCKKICKIYDNGCMYHKTDIVNIDQIPKNINKEEINYIKDDYYLDIKTKNKKENRKKQIYIPTGNNKLSSGSNFENIDKNIEFPTIQQTQTPGQCFKKNNKLYTINIYNKEIIADAPNGIPCYNCNISRYTISGPCINYNCKTIYRKLP